MYVLFAPLVGVLLTVMNSINSRFSAEVGSYLSVLAIHLAGLAAVSLVLLLPKARGPAGTDQGPRPPIHLYLGGFLGVGTVFACNAAFTGLGPSLAVALALLGQMLASLAVDATGFLGRRKYPPSLKSLPGIALCLAGIAVMAGRSGGRLGYMAIALASGILPLLSFILNSQLAQRRGIWRSARVNYVVGLATTTAVLVALRPPLAAGVGALRDLAAGGMAGYVYILGGGILGVMATAITNSIFPRIPALWSTLLMFGGQALAGLALDAIGQGAVSPAKLAGTALVLAGLGANALSGAKPRRRCPS